MKNLSNLSLILSVLILVTSCQDKIEETYKVNVPVYMNYDDLRTSFKVADEQDIIQSGKIYFKDNYILVNEYKKGIHVIDNSNPASPEKIKFIEIPGNVDMAVKGTMLYADSYVDLLTIDISDISNIKEIDRDTNVFPYIIPVFEVGYLEQVDESAGVIVGYEVKERTEKIENNNLVYQRFALWESNFSGDRQFLMNSNGGGADAGIGGSMARFALYDNYLYVVDNASLRLFSVLNNSNPQFEKNLGIGWNIETIFPYQNKLFIGSQTGMFIYSIEKPATPEFVSQFRHASSCDPVVVEGDYAYVTLRGGNLCGAIESQLDVIDISTLEEPKLLKAYPMTEPYGLGIRSDILFVCDGKAGLKVYNAENKLAISDNQIASYPDIHTFDAIPLKDILIMIGVDGLYQFDYSNLEDIKQLSHIPIYDK